MKLYHEHLLHHYRNSPYRGNLENAQFKSAEYNPSCGDRIVIEGMITNKHIATVRFQGEGCVISQAAASLLCQWAEGKTIDEILRFDVDDILSLLKIPLGPTRLKCALLSLIALKDAVRILEE